MISGFERLDVWKLSHELALRIYGLSKSFPHDERFGITGQLRRATLAVPTNIAEGSARQHPKEYLQFCYISRGSVAEILYLLRFVRDLNWIDVDRHQELRQGYERVGQMLNALVGYLRHKKPKRLNVRTTIGTRRTMIDPDA